MARSKEFDVVAINVNKVESDRLPKMIERAKEKGITAVIFDRGGSRYHGRVAAVAEAARAAGLEF